jgi:hypothetical protein
VAVGPLVQTLLTVAVEAILYLIPSHQMVVVVVVAITPTVLLVAQAAAVALPLQAIILVVQLHKEVAAALQVTATLAATLQTQLAHIRQRVVVARER